jgi:hypothetical protein
MDLIEVYSPKKIKKTEKSCSPWIKIMANPSDEDLKELTKGCFLKSGGFSKEKYKKKRPDEGIDVISSYSYYRLYSPMEVTSDGMLGRELKIQKLRSGDTVVYSREL